MINFAKISCKICKCIFIFLDIFYSYDLQLMSQVSIENVVYLKTQIAGQLDDARRRLEDEERRRSLVEASLHQVHILSVSYKIIRKHNTCNLYNNLCNKFI